MWGSASDYVIGNGHEGSCVLSLKGRVDFFEDVIESSVKEDSSVDCSLSRSFLTADGLPGLLARSIHP
jgi:hypothetical protein